MDLTVLYYSANAEDPTFEERITANILEHIGALPLLSVTQVPQPHLGTNICIGRQPVCYETEFKQVAIGLAQAATEYVLVTEADTLYPPDYFRPSHDTGRVCYRYSGVWVHYVNETPPIFRFKKYSHCAQMVRRADWLAALQRHGMFQFMTKESGRWGNGQPVVTFKTLAGVGRKTQTLRRPPCAELPYWGSAQELRDRMFA